MEGGVSALMDLPSTIDRPIHHRLSIHPLSVTQSDVRRRLASIGSALVGAAAVSLAAYILIVDVGGALVAGAVRALVLLPRGVVWLTLALQRGTSGWVIASRVATAAVGAMQVPLVSVALVALELLGVGALFALRTLLRHEGHSADSKERNP